MDGGTPGTLGPGDGLGERLASGLELGWWVSGRGLPISASALAWSPLLTSSPEQPEITWGRHPSLGKHICFASLRLLGPSRAESRRLEETKVLGRNLCGVEEWVPPTPPHPLAASVSAVTRRMTVLLSSHKLITGPGLRMSEVSLPGTSPPPSSPLPRRGCLACPGVWAPTLTCTVGCWPVISSLRRRRKRSGCFLLLSPALGAALPVISPFFAVTVTSVGPPHTPDRRQWAQREEPDK